MLKIIPLGGLGEIGLNMTVFEYSDTIFVLDAGLMFPEEYMLGVDYVIPDFTYLKENKSKIQAIVITHAHEDHIGAIPYVLKEIDIPIFATRFSLEIIKNRLEEHPALSSVRLNEISCDKLLKLGNFELEFIRVSHSAADCVAVAVKTSLGTVIHTGDFKINHNHVDGFATDLNKFAVFGQKGVLALLSDSTNAEQDGYTISDDKIGETLERITAKTKGRIILVTFASSIPRIRQVVEIAEKMKKKVVFCGRSIEENTQIAKDLGYLKILPQTEIDISEIENYPDDKIVIITTGTQGEPMASLARIAAGYHKYIKVKKEDTFVLSSKFIPGNEKAIANIINNLYREGADVIYEKISAIHVSGHAFREELKLMLNLTKPRYFIPVHGEYRHLLLHARLAEESGIPKENIFIAENGEIILFDKDKAKIEDKIITGRILVDGKGIGDVGRSILRERRLLSNDGIVVVNMALDQETGTVIYGPKVFSHGFVFEAETGYLLEDALCVILEVVEETPTGEPERRSVITKKVQSALKKYFTFAINRRPVILPFILEI